MYLHTEQTLNSFTDMVAPIEDCFNWVVGDKNSKVQIFEDQNFRNHTNFNNHIKVAWFKENPNVYDYTTIFAKDSYNPYRYLLDNHSEFDYIISAFKHLEPIVGKEKFIYCPVFGSRIEKHNYNLYEKDKMLSIIASRKDWAIGHRFRHWIIKDYKNHMDIFGNGYNDIIDKAGNFGKIYSLAPYYFSLAIMNSKWDGYFTEVLTDCIAVGTIPIYYGSDDIGDYFNPDGIIKINSLTEVGSVINSLSADLYNSKIKAVEENLEISKKYITDYDYLYENYKTFFDKLEK